MVRTIKKRRSGASQGRKKRCIGKPTGQVQHRVQKVGPQHFGIVAVDCAKRRSKWMLCDFYGRVIIEPTTVEHTKGGLKAMTELVSEACRTERLTDSIVAVEMTGIYHKPPQRAFRKAGFDTRTVHPFASKQYRAPLHTDKTDDNDLDGIFLAAVNGYGLTSPPVSDVYQQLQAVVRHRQSLVKQRSRLMIQIRRLLHLTMPGFADLFDDDKFFHQSIGIPIALKFFSATAIQRADVDGIAKHLQEIGSRSYRRTIERLVAWSGTAAAPSELAAMHTQQWQQLNEVRQLFSRQILAAEQEMAGFLVNSRSFLRYRKYSRTCRSFS